MYLAVYRTGYLFNFFKMGIIPIYTMTVKMRNFTAQKTRIKHRVLIMAVINNQ